MTIVVNHIIGGILCLLDVMDVVILLEGLFLGLVNLIYLILALAVKEDE